MNSSVNQPSDSSNSPGSDPPYTRESVVTESDTPSPNPAVKASSSETLASRIEPIPPPSEPMQYRAIGLVRGRYSSSAEHFTQGTLLATDGTEINAVLLGRIISLVKNHLDLEQEHLWVVYPRTRQKDSDLHLQIVGVWEPEKLDRQVSATTSSSPESDQVKSEQLLEDGYFSVRGEVVYQSASDESLVVKIKQTPRKESDQPKYFKLKLQGVLPTKAVSQFWDLHVRRQADSLVIQQGEAIATLPSKPQLRKRKPYPDGYANTRRNRETPRPVGKVDKPHAVKPPLPKSPKPKPIKRQKPPQ